jgi:hypothetical protein
MSTEWIIYCLYAYLSPLLDYKYVGVRNPGCIFLIITPGAQHNVSHLVNGQYLLNGDMSSSPPPGMDYRSIQKIPSWALVAHACNPSYSGSTDLIWHSPACPGSLFLCALWKQKGNCHSRVILRHRPPWGHSLSTSISGWVPPEQSSELLLMGADSHERGIWGGVGRAPVWYMWEPRWVYLGSSWLVSDDYHPVARHLLGMLREGKSLSSACSGLLMGLMHILQTCWTGEQSLVTSQLTEVGIFLRNAICV